MVNRNSDIFKLLLYKNILSRKRRWILTLILEIAIPLFLFGNVWSVGRLVSTAVAEKKVNEQIDTKICKVKLFIVPNNPFTRKLAEEIDVCLVTKIRNLIFQDPESCTVQTEINRFDSEEDLFEVYKLFNPRQEDIWSGYSFTAAVIFLNRTNEFSDGNLKYTIKVPFSLPKELYAKPNDDPSNLAYERGYATFQLCIDQEFIKIKKNNHYFGLQIDAREMPDPLDLKSDIASENIRQTFCIIAVIAFLIPLCVETLFVSNEKFAGINMLMLLNNVPHCLNLLSWFISGLFVSLFYTVPITVLLKNYSTEDTKPLLQYANFFLFWIMLTMNVAHIIAFGMHVSAYFTKPYFSIVTILIMYVSSTILLESGTNENTVGAVPFFGIIFPNALLFTACEKFNYYEKIGRTGIGWSNLFEVGNCSHGTQGSLGMILIFSVLGTIFHFTMANYVYAINPDKYGIKKSTFSFIKFFMNIKKLQDYNKVENIECSGKNNKLFEPMQDNCIPEIKIRKLIKFYRISSLNRVKKCALRDLSVDFYKNQTTVLFGYSGSGKTTLLSLLTGSSNPSEGFVLINGNNVRSKAKKITRNLGFCLQKDVLFSDLSALQQLSFFNALRNPDKPKHIIDAEVTLLLEKLKLSNKSSTLPIGLSIAQKRKLCLGMALIGNPNILILDEPTSGLDAEDKHDIWNLLLKMNGEKTILISTRDMEEADILGDKIAILHEGELKCYGSPNYLKKAIGKGNFQVTLATDSQCELENISEYFDPNSRVTEISHGKIVLNVPNNNDLPDSLDKIEHLKKELGITGISVSSTTLERVYLEATRSGSGLFTARENLGHMTDRVDNKNYILKALINKKAIYTMNNIGPILMIIIMFFSSLLCTSLVLISESTVEKVKIPVSLDLYDKPTAYYDYNINTEQLALNYKTLVEEQHGTTKALEMNLEYLDKELQLVAYEKNAFDYAYHSLVAAGFDTLGNKSIAIALYNGYRARFTLPISINLVSNALLKTFVGKDCSIETTYEELALFDDDTLVDNLNVNALLDGYFVATILVFFLFPALSLFVVHPLRESLSNIKHLQRMAGVSGLAYWGIMFAFDLVIFLVISIIFIIKFVVMDIIFNLDMFGWQETLILLMLFILFAANTLPLIYAFSFWKESASSAIAILSLVPLGLVLLDILIGTSKLFNDENDFLNVIRWFQKGIFLLTPYVSFFHGLVSFFNNIKIGRECKKVTNLANDQICSLTPCCNGTIPYFKNFEKDVALETSVFYMCLTPIFYFAVLGILECKFIPKVLAKIRLKTSINIDEAIEEKVKKVKYEIAFEATKIRENVVNETTTIGSVNTVENGSLATTSVINREKKNYEFFVFELWKLYKNVMAVKDVSFGIQRGECFGLLGASGAGKTSIVKTVTGEEMSNHGMIYLRGERDLKKVGYCPAKVALIKTLNAYDHLRLFARLRGIAERKIDGEVAQWIERLDLNDCASQPCETYSEGNKKRLTVAMACIGCPKLILLDEPTKELDPTTQKSLQKIIQLCQTAGQSTLLASNKYARNFKFMIVMTIVDDHPPCFKVVVTRCTVYLSEKGQRNVIFQSEKHKCILLCDGFVGQVRRPYQALLKKSHSFGPLQIDTHIQECLTVCKRFAIMTDGRLTDICPSQEIKQYFKSGYEVELKLKRATTKKEIDVLMKNVIEALPCEIINKNPGSIKFYVIPKGITWRKIHDCLREIKAECSCIQEFTAVTSASDKVFSVLIKAIDETCC